MTILKLDIDGAFDEKKFLKDLYKVARTLRIGMMYVSIYQTERGYHIYVNFHEKISDAGIVVLQLYLGSDRERELLNYGRIVRNVKEWNVLFTLKRVNENVVSREKFIKLIVLRL